jgi:hypothetical protein
MLITRTCYCTDLPRMTHRSRGEPSSTPRPKLADAGAVAPKGGHHRRLYDKRSGGGYNLNLLIIELFG